MELFLAQEGPKLFFQNLLAYGIVVIVSVIVMIFAIKLGAHLRKRKNEKEAALIKADVDKKEI